MSTAGERVWLVRHAEAGWRHAWSGPDAERPLDAAGRRQAGRLHALLAPHGVDAARAVVSSPFVRCRQTVEPVAADLGMPVEDDDALTEGAPLQRTLDLIARRPGGILCTHGDVVENVVVHLAGLGVLGGAELEWEKGSTWVLRLAGAGVVAAEHVPPPPLD